MARRGLRHSKHSSVSSNHFLSALMVRFCKVSNWASARVWRNWAPSDAELSVFLRYSELKQLLNAMAWAANSKS